MFVLWFNDVVVVGVGREGVGCVGGGGWVGGGGGGGVGGGGGGGE